MKKVGAWLRSVLGASQRLSAAPTKAISYGNRARPYVRWWWLSGPFVERDITIQLQWIAHQGFGGVELAWIHPAWLEPAQQRSSRPPFLSDEWSALVAFTSREAASLGLGCDFTFGSAWPFGGTWLSESDAAKTFGGDSYQRVDGSWESSSGKQVYVLDHLSAAALERYSQPLVASLAPLISGLPSAFFCDSLEIDTEGLWSPLLWNEFMQRFGYRLEPFAKQLNLDPDVRYDYRKLRGEAIRREFYEPLTTLCHRQGALSRVQCHGAPTDLLAAYAAADLPESEALLFPAAFSRIAASAAAWAGKPIVTAEAFTCMYGFPAGDAAPDPQLLMAEPGDLKLVADALFANGVNGLVWHGMPYRPAGGKQEFYAGIHIASDSRFVPQLPALNDYFTQVCIALQGGATYSSVAVYLANEDALMEDRIADEERTPGANFRWEMRHARQPDELYGFAPTWISLAFLKEAQASAGQVISRHLRVAAIYVDVKWLDEESLVELSRLGRAGAKIVWRRRPQQPGRLKSKRYDGMLKAAMHLATDLSELRPLLTGGTRTPYWTRKIDDELLFFFAHPLADTVRYPLRHRRSEQAIAQSLHMNVDWNGHAISLPLDFAINDGVLVAISARGLVRPISLPRARDLLV